MLNGLERLVGVPGKRVTSRRSGCPVVAVWGRPGALIVSLRTESGRSLESAYPVAEAAGAGSLSTGMSEVRWTNPPQPLGANTAQVSHDTRTCRCLEADLATSLARLASRANPPEVRRPRCRVGLNRPVSDLILLGLVKSARLCRARSASLSSGRSRSREGNPRGVDAMPSIACRRRVSIRVFSDRRAA